MQSNDTRTHSTTGYLSFASDTRNERINNTATKEKRKQQHTSTTEHTTRERTREEQHTAVKYPYTLTPNIARASKRTTEQQHQQQQQRQ